MSILDKTRIGNSVRVNLELSKDRLSKEVIEAILQITEDTNWKNFSVIN